MDKKEKSDLYKYLHKDVKEFNKYILSLVCIGILVLAGLLSYFITTSYAYFTDTIVGKKTIEAKVDTCSQNKPNEPVLDSSMIPVYYDKTTETWKKADSTNKSNNWYDYCEKKWANSVTVSSTNRSKYRSASAGTEIPMDDILTMQVWIPRYKYKVWNYNADGTKTSNEQQIEITFEDGTATTGEITCTDAISGTDGDPSETCKLKSTNATCTDSTCNNKTYTHPAFTFGNEEIKGFWVGKFELTGTISSITTKPNLSSIRNQNISAFETNIMNMKNSNNSYGLSSATDTHMIKNNEWGAVAYLSHSKYGTCSDGTCSEIGINNNSSYTTGCGAEAGSYLSETCNVYNTVTGILASTTGNIYGVYDMSGGALEYTMANIVSTDGATMIPSNSKFTTTTYPNSKYYDKYSYGTSNTEFKRSKLGDGIKEVYKGSYGWYIDRTAIVCSDTPWFGCGGIYNYRTGAGVFNSGATYGGKVTSDSSRLIITPQS